ncbi:Ig-like domain-containing protein [Halobacterium wangiae]|uniref:Ig-like domain-containing protein n=1 Tax=Halobacterium wangiae TaxID=2902623 RepID=UPI001E495BFE|nr:Ig-like domain-containing protein [Halobacterium wangiae]
MRFRDDTRGVTVQVGAVLLFATIIIALSLYQATVVPSQNADVEYKHSQEVQGQLTDVRNALLSTAATGNSQPASVTLGTQYPSRVFLMNPPPSTGTLRTGSYDDDTVSVSNVRATNPETADYVDGNWSASTKYLVYEPDYNEYDGAADLLYESSILSNHYPEQNTTVPLTDQVVVRDDVVTLVALNGTLSTSQSGSVSVDPEALSAPHSRVQVTNDTASPVNVTLPTRASASSLANTTDLAEQDAVRAVEPAGDGRVRLVLEPGTYTLRTASVGVGSRTSNPEPHYLTVVDRDDDSVTVEARDRFNNPESGVEVSVSGTNPFEDASQVTDADGRATFEAAAGESGTATLEILGGGDPRERVTTTVDTSGSVGNGTSGSEAYVVDWSETKSDNQNPGLTCTGENCTLDAGVQSSVTLFADSTPIVDGGTFEYAVGARTVGEVSPGEDATDASGESSTSFTANSNGTTNVYVSGGGSGDRLELTVENQGTGGGGGGQQPLIAFRLDDLTHQDQDSVEYVGSYSISNTNASFERVEVEYANTNDGSATQTLQKAAERGGLQYTNGYGAGDTYDVTVRVIYDDGSGEYVAASRTVTDVADAQNPAANNDISTASTATLDSSSIKDQKNSAEYQVSYTVSPTGGYSETRMVAVSTGTGDKATATSTARSENNVKLQPGYGNGQQFKVAILVFGPDGAVVDDRIVYDTADGTSP